MVHTHVMHDVCGACMERLAAHTAYVRMCHKHNMYVYMHMLHNKQDGTF